MAFNWQITVGNPTLQLGQYFAVKYKKLPSGAWIDFLPNPTTNTFTIPTLEQGQYTAEIRVYCLDGSLSAPTYINNNCGAVIPIAVNCVFSAWSEWSNCLGNEQTRTRTIITPASNGGTCLGDLIETRSCDLNQSISISNLNPINNSSEITAVTIDGVAITLTGNDTFPVSVTQSITGTIANSNPNASIIVFGEFINSPPIRLTAGGVFGCMQGNGAVFTRNLSLTSTIDIQLGVEGTQC